MKPVNLHGVSLDIESSLFSGQSFMWDKLSGGGMYYCAPISVSAVIIQASDAEGVEIICDSDAVDALPPEEWFSRYFSLDVDTESLFSEAFRLRYPQLAGLLARYRGLRVLRQDPFETMVSFMCAQGIGMALIRRQVTMLREQFGEPLTVQFDGGAARIHRFPTPQRLAEADPMKLRACTNNNLARARNIVAASRKVAEGCIDFTSLASPETSQEDIRSALSACAGIGLKIADCIALFGLGRFGAFPIDTHVRQFLGEWFGFPEASGALTDRTYRILSDRATDLLGPELAGYAGHHLFHCWRTEVRGLQAF
ncbi:Fe-S cluster assembly protein HesB [Chlorobium sp. N1]|nr:Fe-S cluster assembly protein HesB [Chlorobium sp. N1]